MKRQGPRAKPFLCKCKLCEGPRAEAQKRAEARKAAEGKKAA